MLPVIRNIPLDQVIAPGYTTSFPTQKRIPTVFVNNFGAMNTLDTFLTHLLLPTGADTHVEPTTLKGSNTVFVDGAPIVRQGDILTCGHTAGGGSPDVNAG